MAADQELPDDQLPAGHTPIWIEPPGGATQVQMLEKMELEVKKYKDVMVLYRHKDDERAADYCRDRGWKYLQADHIYGCEAQCVVLLNFYLRPEFITRAINKMIIFASDR